MLNNPNIAKDSLTNNKVVEKCKDLLKEENSFYKIVSILFTLELVDNWNDIRSICEKFEPEPTIEEWKSTNAGKEYDPYDCVPVPNTAYIISSFNFGQDKYQGSCMISTIRNLLYIFCRNSAADAEVTKTNMREDMATAFNTSINNISGTTSMTVLKEFANNILLGVSKEYQPTLELFACTLNSLLKTELQKNIPMPTPKQYTDNLLGVDESLIDAIFKEITGHNDDITVTKRKQIHLDYQLTGPSSALKLTIK